MRRTSVLLVLVTACGSGGSETEPNPPAPPEARIVSGDQQHGTVDTALAEPLVVEIVDADGHGLPDLRVTFQTGSCRLQLSANFVQTDLSGRASTTVTKLPQQAGVCTVPAGVEGVTETPAIFTVHADPGAAVVLQNLLDRTALGAGFVGHPPPLSPTARALDQYGNPVPGLSVAWSVTAGGGNISPASASTGADGITTPSWTLGPTHTTNSAEVASPGLGTISYTIEAVFPGAGRIVFNSGYYPPHTILKLMNTDGSDIRDMPGSVEGDYQADWFPVGDKLAFLNYAANPALISGFNPYPDLVVMNADGGGRVRLTNHFADSLDAPAVSPDGTQIAFAADKTGRLEIYLVSAAGGTPTQLTTMGGASPAWSPDGLRIAFRQSFQLCIIDVDGSDLTCLVINDAPIGDRIDWSPDGSRIAFSTPEDFCTPYGYVVHPDGSALERIGTGRPSWSPDGSKLVYGWAVCIHGNLDSGIASTDAVGPYDGSYVLLTRSSSDASGVRFPAWGP